MEREDISFDEIYANAFQSFGVRREIAHELWLEAANKLRIPPGKLRPSDRFDGELVYHLPWLPFIDLNDEFYWGAVSRLKRLKAGNAALENAKTLGEYVTTFANLEAAAK